MRQTNEFDLPRRLSFQLLVVSSFLVRFGRKIEFIFFAARVFAPDIVKRLFPSAACRFRAAQN